jgi:hypothetical protein
MYAHTACSYAPCSKARTFERLGLVHWPHGGYILASFTPLGTLSWAFVNFGEAVILEVVGLYPPLPSVEAAWADQLLRQKGLR